jgi:cbb3-type cytochrome oxidase cytochrome c subunit
MMALNVTPMYAFLYNVLTTSKKENLQKATKSSATGVSADGLSMRNESFDFKTKAKLPHQRQQKKRKKEKETEEEVIEKRVRRLDLL